MKIKLSREKVLNTFQNLQTLLQKEWEYKFNYAVIKNKEKLEPITKQIKKLIQIFENQRIKICEQFCQKNEEGNPILVNNNYAGLINNEEFNKEIEKLTNKKIDYFEEEIEFEGYEIQKECVPTKLIGCQQEALMPFIIEENIDYPLDLLMKNEELQNKISFLEKEILKIRKEEK